MSDLSEYFYEQDMEEQRKYSKSFINDIALNQKLLKDLSSEKPSNSEIIISNILDNVVMVQAYYGNILSNSDKYNIKMVIKSLLKENKNGKPIVIDLAMGKGKSLILLEFVKYMCKIDETFSAIIVKKTLQEAKEFVLGLGLKDNEKYSLDEKLEKKYLTNEDLFIAKVVRGFNLNDCIYYNDMVFGNSQFDENEYTYDLCSKCSINACKVKQSKQQHKHHRIIVITHARLFMSNDNIEILDKLSEWEDKKGIKHKRKMLLIDEKINTFNMDTVKLKKWKELKNIIITSNLDNKVKDHVEKIDDYFSNLKYPDNSKEIVEVIPLEDKLLLSSKIIEFLLMQKINPNTINTIDKFLQDGGYISRHWKLPKDEQFSYCKYIEVNEYDKDNFENCIIFDATSKNDYDYMKSDIKFLNDLHNDTNYQVDIYKNSAGALSKLKIIGKGDYERNMNLICEDIKEIITKAKKKTLIIVYKDMQDYSGKKYHFKSDVEKKLIKLGIDTEHEVIHFGQYTTGVNHLKDYEAIIVIGQLDKGTYYYGCKSLCLGVNANDVMINEFLIESIQQIGRTGIRQGKKVDVYMIGVEDKLVEGLQDFFNCNVNNWCLKNFNEFNIANVTQQGKVWYKIVEYVLGQLKEVGDTMRKIEIEGYLVRELSIPKETYESALKSSKTKEILKVHGIISNPNNNRQFMKIE